MSGTAVWTFNELAGGASTGELGNWPPITCPLIGPWSGGDWFDEAIGKVSHWNGVRHRYQNL